MKKSTSRKDRHSAGLPDWQKRIIDKYPDIYRAPSQQGSHTDQVKATVVQEYCNLRSGFECGPGWRVLIEQLSFIARQLVTKLKNSGLQRDASIKPHVVKQKVGELRWQGSHNLSSPFDTLWLAYINQIGWESTQTCELSGEPGKIRNVEGFVICLSDKDYQKWKRNPQKMRLRYR